MQKSARIKGADVFHFSLPTTCYLESLLPGTMSYRLSRWLLGGVTRYVHIPDTRRCKPHRGGKYYHKNFLSVPQLNLGTMVVLLNCSKNLANYQLEGTLVVSFVNPNLILASHISALSLFANLISRPLIAPFKSLIKCVEQARAGDFLNENTPICVNFDQCICTFKYCCLISY